MMKTIQVLTLLSIMTFTSCVYDEMLDEVAGIVVKHAVTPDYIDSRSTDNIWVTDGRETHGTHIDWSSDYEKPVTDLTGGYEDAYIYAYDGSGAFFTVVDGVPALQYSQEGVWMDTGFRFSVTESEKLKESSMDMDFKEAFGSVNFRVKNNEQSLHLQINGVKLCHLATQGSFIFPYDGNEEFWQTSSSKGFLSLWTDTLELDAGIEMVISGKDALPVIPQKTESWNPDMLPHNHKGSYILLSCRLYNVSDTEIGYREGYDIPIWSDSEGGFAEIAIPVSLDVVAEVTQTIDLILETDCPWYDISGWSPSKVLRPIAFAPSVDDWVNGGDIKVETE